eukprot:Skav233635  [mRNA]  locus=scaffold2779:137847:139481:+ [translate_table: standard]
MDVGEGGRSWQVRRCLEKALAWWRETTDVVILNSPWLSRGTSRLFRCVTILYHCVEWLFLVPRENDVFFSPFFYVNALCLVANLWFSLWSRRETFMQTTLFGVGMMLNFYTGYMALGNVVGRTFCKETAALPDFALMCHCNVHPTVLCLGIFYQASFLWEVMDMHVGTYSVFPRIVHVLFFESIILVALAWDFTLRVKAVESGMLFGESDELLESPVAGRSARIFCWFSGVSQWILWSLTIVENQNIFDTLEGRQEDGLFLRNHLPFSSIVVPCLCVGLVLLTWWRRCRTCKSPLSHRCLYMTSLEWHEDIAFAFFCCAPAILFMVNIFASHEHQKVFEFLWYDFSDEMYIRSAILMVASVQTLVPGGCHPLICVIFSAILAAGFGLVWGFTWFSSVWLVLIRHLFGLLVTVLLALSHFIDFFTRLRAIDRGMQQSRQNAASSQMFLPSESTNGLELQFLRQTGDSSLERLVTPPEFLRQTTDLCLDQLAAPKQSGPATVVAVVRHAERADNMQAFDAWGCSKDAADFPHDPPITAAGEERVFF